MVRKKISNYEQPIVRLIILTDNDSVRTSVGINPYKTDNYDDGSWEKGAFSGGVEQ